MFPKILQSSHAGVFLLHQACLRLSVETLGVFIAYYETELHFQKVLVEPISTSKTLLQSPDVAQNQKLVSMLTDKDCWRSSRIKCITDYKQTCSLVHPDQTSKKKDCVIQWKNILVLCDLLLLFSTFWSLFYVWILQQSSSIDRFNWTTKKNALNFF